MNVRIGHAHIKVRDVDRSAEFYSRFIGLRLRERVGDRLIFMSGTDMHHEIALQAVGPEAANPGRSDVGLFHVAFQVPDKHTLATCYQNLVESGVPVALLDHRISWAVYFADPDGNGLELYCDTREDDGGADLWEGSDRLLSSEQLLAQLAQSNRS